MKRQPSLNLSLISIIAALGLLAFAISGLLKNPTNSGLVENCQVKQHQVATASVSTVAPYLAEVKPRFEIADSATSSANSSFVFTQSPAHCLVQSTKACNGMPRPLWLLNRALII